MATARSSSAAATYEGGVSASRPSGTVSGDLLIAILGGDEFGVAEDLTAPSGWSQVGSTYTQISGTGADRHAKMFRKTAGSSEPSSYTFGNDSSQGYSVHLTRYDGHDAADPIASGPVWNDSENTSSHTTATIVLPVDDSALQVTYISFDSTSRTHTGPAALAALSQAGSSPVFNRISAGWLSVANSGNYTGLTATSGGVSLVHWFAALFSIRPAAVAPSFSGTATSTLALNDTEAGVKAASGATTSTLGADDTETGTKHGRGDTTSPLALAETASRTNPVFTTLALAETATAPRKDVTATATTTLALDSIIGASGAQSGTATSDLALADTGTAVKHASGDTTSALGLVSNSTGIENAVGESPSTLSVTETITAAKHASGTVTSALAVADDAEGGVKHGVGADTTALSVAEQVDQVFHAGLGVAESLLGLFDTPSGYHVSGGTGTSLLGLFSDPRGVIEGGGIGAPPGFDALTAPVRLSLGRPLRFIAQEILTGTYLDWDLPLSDVEITETLSGPSLIRGRIAPEDALIRELNLEPWAVWIHVEQGGLIRASGILAPTAVGQGESLEIEAVGVADYPNGMPYTGELSAIAIDPADIVRNIWAHLQSFPDGNLGVTLDPTVTPVRLGEPARTEPVLDENGEQVFDEETDPETGEVISRTPRVTEIEAKPYELVWWEDSDCGAEIDSLATDTPFDYGEAVSWNPGKTAVLHNIRIGYPRLGARRFDIRAVMDENLLEAVVIRESPDHYASQVVVRGKGEGRDSIRGYAGSRSLRRVRRITAVTDKTIGAPARAKAAAEEELRRRAAFTTIGEIVIDANHPNMPVGSFAVGDDILVQADIPWVGRVSYWHRITAITWRPDSDAVTLALTRSEAFSYATAQQ